MGLTECLANTVLYDDDWRGWRLVINPYTARTDARGERVLDTMMLMVLLFKNSKPHVSRIVVQHNANRCATERARQGDGSRMMYYSTELHCL